MKCNNCGYALAEDTLFCPNCGAPAEPAPIVDFSEPQMIFCGHCGNQVPADTAVCSSCGLPPTTVVTPAPQKKKSHLGLWILAAVAGLLTVFVVAGLCTNWFGFYGPATQIVTAANNTIKSGSFTIDLRMNIDYDSSHLDFSKQIDGTIEVEMNVKDRELMMYAKLEAEDETAVLAIYDNHFITKLDGNYAKQNISQELDIFFDNYESTRELDWEELLNSIDEDLYEEVSAVINFDKLEKCLVAYGKNLNNTKWLEENAGYSFSRENGERFHQFKPKTYKFLNTSLECFEAAFEDEDAYEDLKDELKSNKSDLNSIDVEVISGIKSNKLKTLEIKVGQDPTSVKLELKFDKIGDTDVDEDELRMLLFYAS